MYIAVEKNTRKNKNKITVDRRQARLKLTIDREKTKT